MAPPGTRDLAGGGGLPSCQTVSGHLNLRVRSDPPSSLPGLGNATRSPIPAAAIWSTARILGLNIETQSPTGIQRFSFFFFFGCLSFLGPHPGRMEGPRLGVRSELQLSASATVNTGSKPSLRPTPLSHDGNSYKVIQPPWIHTRGQS